MREAQHILLVFAVLDLTVVTWLFVRISLPYLQRKRTVLSENASNRAITGEATRGEGRQRRSLSLPILSITPFLTPQEAAFLASAALALLPNAPHPLHSLHSLLMLSSNSDRMPPILIFFPFRTSSVLCDPYFSTYDSSDSIARILLIRSIAG